MKDFKHLFVRELKEMFSAETQIERALAEMAKRTFDPKLKEAFLAHHAEIRNQIQRLETIGQEFLVNFSDARCEPVKAILKQGFEEIKSEYTKEILDAAMINCIQKVKHFEIAGYGILKSFAKHLKLPKIEKLLEQSSREEGRADKWLTEIAEGTGMTAGINRKACLRKCA